jgi:hypothetical protein
MLQDLVNDTTGPGFPASYKYDGLLRELAALLVPHMIDSVIDRLVTSGMLTTEVKTRAEEIVQEKIDDLGLIDKDMIREVCEEVVEASDIDDKINEYMCNNFDISDYESEIKDIVDVDDALEDRLPDAVMSCVQNLKFNVEVTSR